MLEQTSSDKETDAVKSKTVELQSVQPRLKNEKGWVIWFTAG